MKGHDIPHRHAWVVGIVGLIVGSVFLFYLPTLRGISGVVLLVALIHIVGGIVIYGTVYGLAPGFFGRVWTRVRPRGTESSAMRFDFGWSPGWMNGLWIAALVFSTAAVIVQVAVPGWWPMSFFLLLLAVNTFAGNIFLRSSKRLEYVVLPMVDLLPIEQTAVLDAGCGSGRTTIALAGAHRHARITAFDRFDAEYIDKGGRELLERNLKIVGITDRVTIEQGDITIMPFPDGVFDAAVSAHVMDHLGSGKERGLREILRVLKPGGRFLMIVWVPGWVMFAVANVFSFFLTSKKDWRVMVRRAGFEIKREGMHNGMWFVLLEKPMGERSLTGDGGGF